MTETTMPFPIRIPDGAVKEIDKIIELYGHHSTRPGYIVSAMESLFWKMLDARTIIDDKISKINAAINFDTSIYLPIITKSTVEHYMKEYNSLTGKPVQIMLRVPVGLMNDIDTFSPALGFYSSRLEFVRFAIANQLSIDKEYQKKKDDFFKRYQKSIESAQDAITEATASKDISKDTGLMDMISSIMNQLDEMKQ